MKQRWQSGTSLIELLFSVSIICISAAAISGLMLLNNLTSIRVFNKVDGLNAAREVIERIGADIREAQLLGDQYGILLVDPGNPALQLIFPVDYFPAPLNPFYGLGLMPFGGTWPVAPWPGRPYRLSNTTLVLQLPVFYLNPVNNPSDPLYVPWLPNDPLNGFPMKVDIGIGNPPTARLNPNTDTFVYQVIPDPDRTGEYILQKASFPGLPPPLPGKRRPVINPPQTLLKGIVGPVNPTTGALEVFQYVDKTDPTKSPLNSVGTRVGNVTGVHVNLQIRRTDAGQTAPSTVTIKSTFYMRNNAVATP